MPYPSEPKDPRQAAYEAARREWQRAVWPALERYREDKAQEDGRDD